MKLFTTPSRIVITCANRLSSSLEKEVKELGFSPERVFATGVELQGTLNDCIRLNLNLRCASQVLFSLLDFEAHDPEDVYEALVGLPWESVIPQNGYLSVTSKVDHPSVNNPLFMNVKVKDAIADRIRQESGERPDSGPELSRVVIHLFWKDDWAEIFIDTSGETLAKHGYRKLPGKAPMMESLAAATLMATKWDSHSPFVNPMCGSGTIAIEAALLATHRKPGLYRDNYSFMHLKDFDPKIFEQEKKILKDSIQEIPDLKIIASDISREAIEVSQTNAKAAGVEKYIQFSVGDFETTPVPESPGIVYFNPEYGERLGDERALEETYSRMGDFLKKKCKGYWGYIFTGNLELAKKIGLKPTRRYEFYTAKIDCRLLEYELYAGSKRALEKEIYVP